jgi:uncharacterized protein
MMFWDDPYIFLIAIVGGFLAGVINTLAGNGSAITLAILTEVMQLPGNLANGTNRVGILAQGLSSTGEFFKSGIIPFRRSKLIIVVMFVGSMIGVALAVSASNEQFMFVYKYMMLIMLAVILVKPGKWLRKADVDFKLSPWMSIPIFLLLGIYGGFIQMGMGIFFLAAMVLVARFEIMESNAVKTIIVTFYTIIVLIIFQWKGLVDWRAGAMLAVGQASGGYVTAKFGSKSKYAGQIAYYLLLVIVVTVVIRLFIFTE